MKKMCIPSYVRDDYYGFAAEGLCKAAMYYDSSKGKFDPFANQCIKNEINDERKHLFQTDKCKGNSNAIHFDDYIENQLEKREYKKFQKSLNIEGTISEVMGRCNYREVKILQMIYEGYTYDEIAQELEMSVSGVKKIMSRIRKRVKEKCEQDEASNK